MINEETLAERVRHLGDQIHNVSCAQQNNEELCLELSNIAYALWEASRGMQQNATPANRWAEAGEEDPHKSMYDGERAALTLGKFTDDELANGAFMNYNLPMDINRVLARDPDYHSPIAWMTAVKERIRWLSRKLTQAEATINHLRTKPQLTVDLVKPRTLVGEFKISEEDAAKLAKFVVDSVSVEPEERDDETL